MILNSTTPGKIDALTRALSSVPFTYGAGFRLEPLSQLPPYVAGKSRRSGTFERKVDASGFARWCVRHACGTHIPETFAAQRWFFATNHFEKGVPEDGAKRDGFIRIVFLDAASSLSGYDHVMLVVDGQIYESHPPIRGPLTRPWRTEIGCELYILSREKSDDITGEREAAPPEVATPAAENKAVSNANRRRRGFFGGVETG